MKKLLLTLASVLFLIAFIGGAVFYWRNLRGTKPAITKPPENIATIIEQHATSTNSTGFPLHLPSGFSIEIFAKNLPGARVMRFDAFNNLLVSRTSEGAITMLEVREGIVKGQSDVLRNLRKPHGLAFDPQRPNLLFYAEENRISRVALYGDGEPEKIADLPSGSGHFTRTLGFGPDSRLYVSIGSSCNVCVERDDKRAKIFSLNPDGSDMREFARGLRNAVFFAWHPKTHQLWATEMGRDLLGDDTPPDELNIITQGKNYGWPICYGNNVHETDFDHKTYIRNPCMEPFETPAFIAMQAHSAPLGLAFIPSDAGWPEQYQNNLLVAFHGSWNRSVPTGYKIIRYALDAQGKYQRTEDFISGWLTQKNQALGRPVDLLFGPDNALYISDDKAGVIYRVSFAK